MGNPRRANGWKRDQLTKRLKAMRLPCAICGKPIDYELTTWTDPKDGKVKPHPMRFEVDEIIPVALGGSPFEWSNLQPAHRKCNQSKGKLTMAQLRRKQQRVGVAAEAARSRCKAASEEIRTSRHW